MLQSILQTPNLKALVLETYGTENASTEDWLLSSKKKAIKNGMQIVKFTHCSGGSVIMGKYEVIE